MRYLHAGFCAFAFVASLIALANHAGLDLWGCASCSFVRDMPLSPVLACGGPALLAALTYGLYKEAKWAKIGLVAAGVGSVALMNWMIQSRTICLVCVLVHIGTVSAAVSLVPRAGAVACLLFATGVIFTATGGWDRFASAQGTAVFRPRPREPIPEGSVYVLFTDPECERCRIIEKRIATLPSPPKILHRWSLLPHSMYRGVRAAAVFESARMRSPDAAERLRRELLSAQPPLSDAVLLAAAERAGLAAEAREWLDEPHPGALVAIDEDQATTKELGIQSLPALAELSAAGPGGVRTLRLVPFTAIGIRP